MLQTNSAHRNIPNINSSGILQNTDRTYPLNELKFWIYDQTNVTLEMWTISVPYLLWFASLLPPLSQQDFNS